MEKQRNKIELQQNIDLGKIPPQAIDCEVDIIAMLLNEPLPYMYDIKSMLKGEMFYKDQHQIIFNTLIAIEGIPNLTLLTERLKKNNKLEIIGGSHYLMQIFNKYTTSIKYHLESYCLVILEKYLKREIIRLAEELKISAFDESIDIEDLLTQIKVLNTTLDFIIQKGMPEKAFKDIINNAVDKYYERELLVKEGKTIGICTQISKLNRITDGFYPGDLIILAGRPSHGKTALALSFSRVMAFNKKKVVFFSYETTELKIANRIIIGVSGVNSEDFKGGTLTDEDKKTFENSINKVLQLGIGIDEKRYTISQLEIKIKTLVNKGECDIVFIDYLQLIRGDRRYNSRFELVTEISIALKGIAKDCDIPIIALCQLNREVEKRSDKRPIMSDLREAGQIEQDADVIIFIHRPEYYNIDEPEGVGELIISKNKEGRTGIVDICYNQSLTNFFEPEDKIKKFFN